MADKKIFIGLALVAALLFFFSGGFRNSLGFSVVSPFQQITLTDGNQYWYGTFLCNNYPAGDTYTGYLNAGNTSIGSKTYERKAYVEVSCVPGIDYLKQSLTLQDSLGSSINKYYGATQGESHAPFAFTALKMTGGNVQDFEQYDYDPFVTPDQFSVGTSGVQVDVQGQIEQGLVPPDLSNVLVFKGLSSDACGFNQPTCAFQVDRNDWQNARITSNEQQQCGFPGDLNIIFGASPASLWNDLKGSESSTSGRNQYARALRCWSALHPPAGMQGFAFKDSYVIQNGFARWDYPTGERTGNSLIGIKVPLSYADTFVYDVPSLNGCTPQITQFSYGAVGASGTQATLRVRNNGPSTCTISALVSVKSGFNRLSFNPNPIVKSVANGAEGDFGFYISPTDVASNSPTQICVSATSPDSQVSTSCVSGNVDTGGKAPSPTPTPSPGTNQCPSGYYEQREETRDLFGNVHVVTTCVANPIAGGLDLNFIAIAVGGIVLLLFLTKGGKNIPKEGGKLVVPVIVGGVVWFALQTFSIPILGQVFAGASVLVGAAAFVVAFVLLNKGF